VGAPLIHVPEIVLTQLAVDQMIADLHVPEIVLTQLAVDQMIADLHVPMEFAM
jgi:hypothetical protein